MFSCTVLAQPRCSLVVRVYRHTFDLHALAWLKTEAHLRVSPQNTSSSARHVIHHAEPDTTPEHCFLTFSRTSLPKILKQPCEDQRPQQRGALTETPPLTSFNFVRTCIAVSRPSVTDQHAVQLSASLNLMVSRMVAAGTKPNP